LNHLNRFASEKTLEIKAKNQAGQLAGRRVAINMRN